MAEEFTAKLFFLPLLLIFLQAHPSQQPWGKALSMPASCNYQQQAPQVKQQPMPGTVLLPAGSKEQGERLSLPVCLLSTNFSEPNKFPQFLPVITKITYFFAAW